MSRMKTVSFTRSRAVQPMLASAAARLPKTCSTCASNHPRDAMRNRRISDARTCALITDAEVDEAYGEGMESITYRDRS